MHWTVHLEGGPRRVNHAAVAVGEKIYSFGGYCTGDDYYSKGPIDVHVLNTYTYRWSVIPLKTDQLSTCQVPFQRYGHTAVTFDDKVYLWGGRNDETACNILFCFDPKTHYWSTPVVSGTNPEARDGHSACVIGHFMFIFGGFVEDMEMFSQDLHRLDLRTMKWTFFETTGEAPSFRDFHTATAVGGRMYVYGGRGYITTAYPSQQEVYCEEIKYLDVENRSWHQPATVGKLPCGRRSHSVFLYKGKLYVFGGYNGVFDEHYNDMYSFCPVTNEWQLVKTLGKPPCKRRRQSCIVMKDKMFLFGGTSPHSHQPAEPAGRYFDDDFEDDWMVKLMDHGDTYVLDFSPSLKTLCVMAVLKHRLDLSCLPYTVRWDIRAMTTPNKISRQLNSNG